MSDCDIIVVNKYNPLIWSKRFSQKEVLLLLQFWASTTIVQL